MTTLLVDHSTLLVHHIIVVEQVLTDTEVVLFHLLLCILDRLGDERMLQHLAFLESKAVHEASHLLGSKLTHQVVFQRHEED